MRPRHLLPALLLLLAATLAARPADAQAVRGTFVDGESGEPIAGATVALLTESGRRVMRTLTDEQGRFTLRAPSGGRYVLSGERIGFQATRSEPLLLQAGQTVEHRLRANPRQVALEGLVVESRSRCVARPGDQGEQTALVWEEARKALEATEAAARDELYRFRVTRYAREVDLHDATVLQEESRQDERVQGNPFATVDPGKLARDGFIETEGDATVFYAPDAAVLLSDRFLEDHCFRVVEGPSEAPELIGLAFEPGRGRRVPDVEGTLWIDRATAELRRMEYEYTRSPVRGPDGVPGGTMEFLRLPNGSWIVQHWQIRMPVPRADEAGWRLGQRQAPARAGSVREEGGDVSAVFTTTGQAVAMEREGVLAGMVWDSTRAAPLAGARVFLSGTSLQATTDSAGRWTIRGVREGRYGLAFASPRLDTLGYVPEPVSVAFSRGATIRRDLAIPTLPNALAQGCDAGGAVVGSVRDEETGRALTGARVAVRWAGRGGRSEGLEGSTGPGGFFRICGVPSGVPLALDASAAGATASAAGLRVAQGAPLHQDLAVPASAALAAGTMPTASAARVEGRVVDAGTGEPVAGATVRIGGRAEQRTGRDGAFAFGDVPPGRHVATVTRPGGAARTVEVEVGGSAGTALTLRVPSADALALEPLVATARPMTRGARAARARGRRMDVFTRADIEERLGASRDVGDVVRRFPGVRVRELRYGRSLGGLARGLCVQSDVAAPTGSSLRVSEPGNPLDEPTLPGPSAGGDGGACPNAVTVFLNDVLIGDSAEMLRQLDLEAVESIEYISGPQVPPQYAAYRQNGVLLIYTRGNGPHVDAAS